MPDGAPTMSSAWSGRTARRLNSPRMDSRGRTDQNVAPGQALVTMDDASYHSPQTAPQAPAVFPALGVMTRREVLISFYALLDRLQEKAGGKRTLSECSARMGWQFVPVADRRSVAARIAHWTGAGLFASALPRSATRPCCPADGQLPDDRGGRALIRTRPQQPQSRPGDHPAPRAPGPLGSSARRHADVAPLVASGRRRYPPFFWPLPPDEVDDADPEKARLGPARERGDARRRLAEPPPHPAGARGWWSDPCRAPGVAHGHVGQSARGAEAGDTVR
jgi:hypothetical protein